jgi:hypothetical protein
MKTLIATLLILVSVSAFAISDTIPSWQVSPGFQLGSTKYTTHFTLGRWSPNHLWYAGIKTQLTNGFSYGKRPLGVVAGFGYKLMHQGKWLFQINPDVQWMTWKSPYKSTRNHYFDVNLNYRLNFLLKSNLHFYNAVGFGFALKHNKNEAWGTSITRPEVSGMIQIGLSYLLKQ